jgi:hypothetical protein
MHASHSSTHTCRCNSAYICAYCEDARSHIVCLPVESSLCSVSYKLNRAVALSTTLQDITYIVCCCCVLLVIVGGCCRGAGTGRTEALR